MQKTGSRIQVSCLNKSPFFNTTRNTNISWMITESETITSNKNIVVQTQYFETYRFILLRLVFQQSAAMIAFQNFPILKTEESKNDVIKT